MSIAWGSLAQVFLVGVGVTVAVVVLFSLGVTGLAARADTGETGGGAGARTGQGTVVAALCFAVCVLVVGYGVYLIVA
jgi:hypothetical protein